MAADRPIWYIKPGGDTVYRFDPEELLGVKELRQIKQWFGQELGTYLSFQARFTQGDPDAAVCAAWLVRRAAGEQGVPEPPNYPSFNLGPFFDNFEPTGQVLVDGELKEIKDMEVESEEKDPTNTAPSPTSVSTETRTDSEPKT